MTFEQWKQQVNLLFIADYGMDSECFPDYLWYDDYKDGFSPVDAYDNWKEDNDD
jgi:hypothetical protein